MQIWMAESNRLKEFLRRREAARALKKTPLSQAGFKVQRVVGTPGRGGDVVVIPIIGVLMRRPDFLDLAFGAIDTDLITRAVQDAASDRSVGAIVLRVDSPGGSVDGLYELTEAVRLAARQKRVIGAVDGLAASAAYMAIAHATEITARHSDMVGSIGTRLTIYDFSGSFEKAGIRAIPIDTGPYKSTGEFGTKLTDDQQAYLQSIVDGYFGDFRNAVMLGRRLNISEFMKVADGRVFRAGEAKTLRLADRIVSSVDSVIAGSTPSGLVRAERANIRARSALGKIRALKQQYLASEAARARAAANSEAASNSRNSYRCVDMHDPPARRPTGHDQYRVSHTGRRRGLRG